MKLYYFYTLKALWDGQVKIKMYYGICRVKKQLSGKRAIAIYIYIDQYLEKLGLLIEYNMRNIFLKKSYKECDGNYSQTLS